MSHRPSFKFVVLGVIVSCAFILVISLAFKNTAPIQAQTNGGTLSEPSAIVGTSEPPGTDEPKSSDRSPQTLAPQSLQSSWPTHWYTVVGAVFQPANSGYSYQYGYNGCVKSDTSGYWRASVNLPDKSVAKYIYINYENDAYASNSTAWLSKYRYDGSTYDLKWVNSRNYTTTGTGYYFDLSGEFTDTVDNLQYGYVFIWSGSATQRLCSVQVGYYAPSAFGAVLPLIMRH
jgi:hypothetical protein